MITMPHFSLFSLSGYNHICNYRTKRLGGGVSLYVKQTLKYQRLSDLEIFNEDLETIFIEIPKDVIGSKSNIIVGIIYRPPDKDITQFNDYIINILSQFKQTNKVIYIMGDFNINLLNSEKHVKTSEFLENMYSFSFFPLIHKPTRVTKHTATLIDNIFCKNSIQNNSYNGILYTDISDHFPIFTINLGKLGKGKLMIKALKSFKNLCKQLIGDKCWVVITVKMRIHCFTMCFLNILINIFQQEN